MGNFIVVQNYNYTFLTLHDRLLQIFLVEMARCDVVLVSDNNLTTKPAALNVQSLGAHQDLLIRPRPADLNKLNFTIICL